MKLFVGYASKEGQARKIARHIADFAFDTGHSVELQAVADDVEVRLERFDAVILTAPIDAGHYPKPFTQFVAAHAETLNPMQARLVTVSLAAAGHDAEDWRSLEQIANDFGQATGWKPIDTKQVAGAYMPSKYDILTRFIMRRIIAQKDPEANLGADKEYTDWVDLNAWINRWLNP